MRYSTSEKLEIIRLVEQSHLPVRRTLEQTGDFHNTFMTPQVCRICAGCRSFFLSFQHPSCLCGNSTMSQTFIRHIALYARRVAGVVMSRRSIEARSFRVRLGLCGALP